MFPHWQFGRLLLSCRHHPLLVRHLYGGRASGASLQLVVPPAVCRRRRRVPLPHPVADDRVRHRVREAGAAAVAGGGVRGPRGGSRGAAGARGLFAGYQRRADRRHGAIRELHGGGRGAEREDPGLHPGRPALRVRPQVPSGSGSRWGAGPGPPHPSLGASCLPGQEQLRVVDPVDQGRRREQRSYAETSGAAAADHEEPGALGRGDVQGPGQTRPLHQHRAARRGRKPRGPNPCGK